MSELLIELALIAMIVVPAIATSLHPARITGRNGPASAPKITPHRFQPCRQTFARLPNPLLPCPLVPCLPLLTPALPLVSL